MPIPEVPGPEVPARFVYALSGGVDSICQLDWLVAAGRRPIVAHFNHRWAKQEDITARFCANHVAELGLPFVFAEAPHSVPHTEESARKARYRFLVAVAKRRKLGVIITAHNADDQAETLLLRLIRGAGVRGLAAMRPEARLDRIKIVRPWLGVYRAEIEARARARGLEWREDPFNKDLRLLRSRVRHRLMPLLRKEFAADIAMRLVRTAEILAEEDSWFEASAREALAKCRDHSDPGRLVTPVLAALPQPLIRRIMMLWFAEHRVRDVGFAEIESAIGLLGDLKTSKVNLPGGRFLRRREKRLFIEGARK